jgi:large subunit ribosomal protein L22
MPVYEGGDSLRRIVRRGTNKAPFGRVVVQTSGNVAVVDVRTVKPDTVQNRRGADLVPELEKKLGGRAVTIQVTPEAHAHHKFVRVSATKARRIMDEVRGRYVDEALALLQFMPNKAARLVSKLIRSASANAFEGWGADPKELKVVTLTADVGPTMKRIQPRAMGRAYRILKRSAHLFVAVTAAEPRPLKGKGARKGRAAVTRAEAKPAAAAAKASTRGKKKSEAATEEA